MVFLIILLWMLWMLWMQASALVDSQKANREVRAARMAAIDSEDSRLVKLEENLQSKFDALEGNLADRIGRALKSKEK